MSISLPVQEVMKQEAPTMPENSNSGGDLELCTLRTELTILELQRDILIEMNDSKKKILVEERAKTVSSACLTICAYL